MTLTVTTHMKYVLTNPRRAGGTPGGQDLRQ